MKVVPLRWSKFLFRTWVQIQFSMVRSSRISSKVLIRIERGFLHNVWNLVDITSSLEILNLNSSIERYDSKLRCPSFWDTLYMYITLWVLRYYTVMYWYSFNLLTMDFQQQKILATQISASKSYATQTELFLTYPNRH